VQRTTGATYELRNETGETALDVSLRGQRVERIHQERTRCSRFSPAHICGGLRAALGVATQSAYCREYGLRPRCHVESPSSEVLG